MIEGIEISKSDRAKCRGCGKKIGKGIPRGVEGNYHNNHREYIYYCYKCLGEKFEIDKKDAERLSERIGELKEELNKMIEENKDIITKNEIIEGLK